MKILVTGAAGFIGSFLCKRLLNDSANEIIGLDNMNDYYDVALKENRLKALKENNKFIFIKGDISNKLFVDDLFNIYKFDIVVNLAAQAGVRYSIDHPDAYIQSNIIGFYNILEACRFHLVKHLIYASSSSVYGGNEKTPFSEEDKVDNPVSLYAATKKCDELLAYSYSKLYGIKTTGLRFFTVYGPMGRPDMAYFLFANKLVKNETIELYNFGKCKRDFTYIDDIVECVTKIVYSSSSTTNCQDLKCPPYKIYNIGNSNPVCLLSFFKILSEELINAGILPANYDVNSHIKLVPLKKGDVPITYADVSELEKDFGFKPSTSLRDGLRQFAEWYKMYYEKDLINSI